MAPKKNKRTRPWWQIRRFWRRVAIGAAVVAVVAIFAAVAAFIGGRGGEREEIGQQLREAAPPFELPTIDGGTFSSADHLGQHALLLFINEGIGCGPCFDQIVDLEEDWKRFEALGVQLVSIMIDPKEALMAEARDRGITTVVAMDEDKKVSNAYEAMEASMHPGIRPGHTFVLVDKEGQMIWRVDWLGSEMAGGVMYMDVDDVYDAVSHRLQEAGGQQPAS